MKTPPMFQAPEPETLRSDPQSARDLINALGRIYLEAGLPLAAAFEAAMADYQCTIQEQLCAV